MWVRFWVVSTQRLIYGAAFEMGGIARKVGILAATFDPKRKFAFLDPVWFLTVDGRQRTRALKGDVDIGFAAAKRDGRPQSDSGSTYAFRPAAPQDLPLLQHWLRTPRSCDGGGNAEEQAVLLREDMDEPRMVMRIVCFEGRPFAYAQDYAVHVWPQPHFTHLPSGSRAIDSFIGEPDMIGRVRGSAYLKLLAERLRVEGAPVVAIDPDVDNLCARRAAGFRGDTVVDSGEGPAILMIFDG